MDPFDPASARPADGGVNACGRIPRAAAAAVTGAITSRAFCSLGPGKTGIDAPRSARGLFSGRPLWLPSAATAMVTTANERAPRHITRDHDTGIEHTSSFLIHEHAPRNMCRSTESPLIDGSNPDGTVNSKLT